MDPASTDRWELLVKEEKKAELINNIDLNLKIQRLKLSILPYFRQEKFSDIKAKMLSLQKKQAKIDELQIYFIQIKQDLKQKIEFYLKNLMEFINSPVLDCHECKGQGVFIDGKLPTIPKNKK